MPGITLGDTIPNMEVDSTHGRIKLQDHIKDSWAIIFSHPADFIPKDKPRFYVVQLKKRGVKMVGITSDRLSSQLTWIKNIEYDTPGIKEEFPIVSDPNGSVIRELNMVDPEDEPGVESRSVHVIGPDGRVKLCMLYPSSVGRNVDEVVRAVDSLQKTATFKVATPVNWRPGEPVVISPSVSNEEANKMFPQGYRTIDLPSKKEYLRFTKLRD